MEFNFNTRNPYSYMKYSNYKGKYKGTEYYLVPSTENSLVPRDLYDMFSKIDWIIEYAKYMYNAFKSIINLSNSTLDDYDKICAKDILRDFTVCGVPYQITIYGTKPEIAWKSNSLKQALDLAFDFFMCSEKNPIKMCKHCSKIFLSKNPKSEYCSPQCRNQANVYKSREKNK